MMHGQTIIKIYFMCFIIKIFRENKYFFTIVSRFSESVPLGKFEQNLDDLQKKGLPRLLVYADFGITEREYIKPLQTQTGAVLDNNNYNNNNNNNLFNCKWVVTRWQGLLYI
jgi:hypothetical protein